MYVRTHQQPCLTGGLTTELAVEETEPLVDPGISKRTEEELRVVYCVGCRGCGCLLNVVQLELERPAKAHIRT